MIDKLLDFIYYPDKSFHNNDGKSHNAGNGGNWTKLLEFL